MINTRLFKKATWFFKYNHFDRNINEFLSSSQFEELVSENYEQLSKRLTTILKKAPKDMQKKIEQFTTDNSVYPTYKQYRRDVLSIFKIQLYLQVKDLAKLVRQEAIDNFYAEILGIRDTYQPNLEKVKRICKKLSSDIETDFFKAFYKGYFPSNGDISPEFADVLKSVFGAKNLIPIEAIPDILNMF